MEIRVLTKTHPSPEQQWCCPGQGVVIEERAVLTLIVHIKVTSRGSENTQGCLQGNAESFPWDTGGFRLY